MSQLPAEDLESKKEESKKDFEETLIKYPSLKKMMDVKDGEEVPEVSI